MQKNYIYIYRWGKVLGDEKSGKGRRTKTKKTSYRLIICTVNFIFFSAQVWCGYVKISGIKAIY